MERRVIRVALLATILALAAAPAALAVTSTVRVQGAKASQVVSAGTPVSEASAGGTILDTDGTSLQTQTATALGATSLALRAIGVPWDMSVSSYGAFVNSINGLASDPVDYSNWWALVVNGYMSPVGAGSLQTLEGDSYIWFQNPDATFSKGSSVLVVKPQGGTAKQGFVTGSAVDLTVAGDDLSKVNSEADAARFSSPDIQEPSDFPSVGGATIHVGERVYRDAEATLSITDLAAGTYAVWAEKGSDDASVYVRSETTLINVGSRPSISGLTALRTDMRTVRVRYALSKSSNVTVIIAKGGKQIGNAHGKQASGLHTQTVRLSSSVAKAASLRVTVTALDVWGRSAVKSAALKVR